jgi:hypothetical protein
MVRRHLSAGARWYIAGVSVAAIIAAVMLSRMTIAPSGVVVFAMVAGLGMLAHAYPVQGFRHQAYQVSLPFIVVAAALFSPPQLLVFVIGMHVAEQARLRRRLAVQWFNLCNYFISAALAAAFYQRAAELLPDAAVGHLVAALAAGCAFIMLNRALLAGVLWLARGLRPAESGLFSPELLSADLVIAWMAGPMLVLLLEAGPWTILISAGPLLLARPALSMLLTRRRQQASRRQARAA